MFPRLPSLPLALAFALAACATPAFANERVDGPQAREAAESANRFALDFYKTCGSIRGNLLFSPHSISTALAMTREGARGATAAEMNAALHFPKGEALTAGQAALRLALRPQRPRHARQKVAAPFSLSVANRLFGAVDAAFHPAFTTQLADAYDAPMTRLDFTRPEVARNHVNQWVEERTNNRIKDFLPKRQLNARTRLVLVNATYFKASWQTPFLPMNTRKAPWHGAEGAKSEAMLMRNVGYRNYAEAEGVQIVELGYKSNQVSLVVVLPREKGALARVEKSLDLKTLKGWVGALKSKRVDVSLPRFKFTSPSIDLKEQLRTLGIERAFDPKLADFGGMSAEKPLFIGSVLHKATINLDEKGTEAAAATAVLMTAGGPPPGKPLTFRADHPFLFFVRHRDTGAILFVGRMVKPQ